MKKAIKIILIILILILTIPVRIVYKDGGTVHYRALTYSIYDVHRINPDEYAENMFIEGVIIEILGVKIFDSTR